MTLLTLKFAESVKSKGLAGANSTAYRPLAWHLDVFPHANLPYILLILLSSWG
jgi:hypothetical protein